MFVKLGSKEMDPAIPLTVKIKHEPVDEQNESFVPALAPSQGPMEFFLANDFKKEEAEYYHNKVKCLDETDGKFKNFTYVSAKQSKLPQECDFKNYCTKCNKHFDNLVAAQNHYVFTHPDSSLLASITPQAKQEMPQRRFYNWLNEPIQVKQLLKNKKEYNIGIIKDQQEHLKKLIATKPLVQITEHKVVNPCADKEYTLESIKNHPLDGIKVVKKSDIQFNELRTKAEKKLLCDRSLERVPELPPKKIAKRNRQLIRIEIKDALKAHSKLKLFKEFIETLRNPQGTARKYVCSSCDLQISADPLVFDNHMRQHITASFGCSFCMKTFCTKVGAIRHAQLCEWKLNNV